MISLWWKLTGKFTLKVNVFLKAFCKAKALIHIFPAEFASFLWSPDESKILYVAERKQTKGEEFYKRKPTRDSVDEGEKLNGTVNKSL